MYLMYVDESGDPGNNTDETDYFCLSSIVVHESDWRTFIDASISFRRTIKDVYGFPVREEIHAAKILRHSSFGIEKHRRLAILRNYLDEIAKMNYLSITNVVVDKRGKPTTYDVFGVAWRTLFQRFENTLINGNFPGGFKRSFGSIYTDATRGEDLNRIVRRMSVHNPIPNSIGSGYRNIPILRVIEDPSERNSAHSLPIQACDTIAYFLHQSLKPNSYVKRSGATHYFKRLIPVLNTRASSKNPEGTVFL